MSQAFFAWAEENLSMVFFGIRAFANQHIESYTFNRVYKSDEVLIFGEYYLCKGIGRAIWF